MRTVIKLEKNNITEWKRVLDSYMKKRVHLDNYSQTMSDDEWIDMFEGQTPTDVYVDFCLTD